MIGVLGGTFDPIHFGHLRTGLEVAEACDMEQLRFIPGSIPPHRPQPLASAQQRLEMIRRAIAGETRFMADDRELRRAGASYTVDTLQALRNELGDQVPIAFILGMDAFLSLRSWHRWQTILDRVHLVVMHRPGYEPDPSDWYEARLRENDQLSASAHGGIAFQIVTQLDISATLIRETCQQGKSVRYLLPEAVCEYIAAHNLYKIQHQQAR